MSKGYWSGVGKRLASLAKTAAPVAIDAAIAAGINKICDIVEKKLNEMFKQSLFNSLISFVLNCIGFALIYFKPVNEKFSLIAGLCFFASTGIFFLYRTIKFFIQHGKEVFSIVKKSLKNKSIYKGTESFIIEKFPQISLVYAGIDIASNYIPHLKNVPSISETARFLVKTFWKKVAVFFTLLMIYSILMFFLRTSLF